VVFTSLLLIAGNMLPATSGRCEPRCLCPNDARIVVDVARVTGGYVSLARLKLFQIEPEPDGKEGVQSTASVLRTRMLNCAPSPFSRMATVSYELGQAGSVELTVRDVSGGKGGKEGHFPIS